MKCRKQGDLLIIKMEPGEEIVTSLKSACRENEIKTAVVMSSIGQLKDIELGYFVKKGDYFPEILQDTYELLSISGIITEQDGQYLPHLHAILGSIEKEALGGHLIRGTVEITNETILRISYIGLGRTLNERTGLMDLDPS